MQTKRTKRHDMTWYPNPEKISKAQTLTLIGLTSMTGVTRHELSKIGVPWPPPRGWRKKMIAVGAKRHGINLPHVRREKKKKDAIHRKRKDKAMKAKMKSVIRPAGKGRYILTFGKHEGETLSTVPVNYLSWMESQMNILPAELSEVKRAIYMRDYAKR